MNRWLNPISLLLVFVLAGCSDDTLAIPATDGLDALDSGAPDASTPDTSGGLQDASDDDSTDSSGETDTQPTSDAGEPEDTGPPPCVGDLDCDDGNPCTWQDQCLNGFCVGQAYTCDDGRECTEDACDGDGGCLFSVALGYCLIGTQIIRVNAATPMKIASGGHS